MSILIFRIRRKDYDIHVHVNSNTGYTNELMATMKMIIIVLVIIIIIRTIIIQIIIIIIITRNAIVSQRYAFHVSTCQTKENLLDYRIQSNVYEVCSFCDNGDRKGEKCYQNGPKRTKWRLDGHA